MEPYDSASLWSESLRHVKFWRNEVKRSFGETINCLEIIESAEGEVKILGLANTCDENVTSQQTIVVTTLPKCDNQLETEIPPLLELKAMFDLSNLGKMSDKPSPELCLLYERLRGQIVSGISSFSLHPRNNAFLLTSGSQLHLYQDNNLTQIATYAKSAVLNATFSPVDPDFVAFSCKGRLHIDNRNEEVFASELFPNTTNGVASFIAQEEFERFDGFWWSPTRLELLYERVDESDVVELSFITPGQRLDTDSKMRYPVAGTTNPVSTLRICHINADSNNLVLDMELQLDIKKVVPWFEYLVSCGWTHDGENIYMYIMNREQTHSALLLLPRIVFGNELLENAEIYVKVLYEEESDNWINWNNLFHFLPSESNDCLRAIIGSEKQNLCHLYLHTFDISRDVVKLDEIHEDMVKNEFTTSSPVLQPQIIENSVELPVADPLIASTSPPIQVVEANEIAESGISHDDVPLWVPIPGGERRPSTTVHRFSTQIGVLANCSDLPITDIGSDWAIIKEAIISVDYLRQHVYYLCNKASPTIFSLAVSSYCVLSRESKLLTPDNLCYKFERAQPTLSVNPNVGFVCWVSNVQKLPECRFYRLVHNQSNIVSGIDSFAAELPTAVYTYRIGVHMTDVNPLTSMIAVANATKNDTAPTNGKMTVHKYTVKSNYGNNKITSTTSSGQAILYKAPTDLFHSKVFEYRSAHTNQLHYALLMWPAEGSIKSGFGINQNASNKFPVIHSVYAGPSVQLVKDNWHGVAHHLKYVTIGYAVLMVDGRGSANRGVDFEAHVKYHLGSVELEDQIEGLQVVARETGDLLDISRVGVIGWSYGGYMSLLLLACYSNIYKAACVGGAVSDWALYDTAYTERYMGTPQEHEEDYRASSAIAHLDKLPDESGRLLIVHGMLDENVHFRHTEKLINGLVHAGKPHQLLLLPNERHSVRKGDTIEYFHATMLSFFVKALS